MIGGTDCSLTFLLVVINTKKEMKETTSYLELLKDPRWQKKRLEIMQRDHFICTSCDCADKTLNIHHAVKYRKNTKPWEYENAELFTLCETCHKKISDITENCNSIIMGGCYNIDRAKEFYNILCELDGLHIVELHNIYEILHLKRIGRGSK